ncbi:uncharacterized protein E6C27_scaffold35G00790 [Cucumis melo var. makuwa]|uniref:Gag protease polyprotein n=1 Tax=Cucumis melo var. makuwa TaxID=1194695 RepID=A0A5A7TBJ0_CUCMM|nr:uncharacterized protein E6C27_scaffold35G00790 [Cucumis melo var. makuwa]
MGAQIARVRGRARSRADVEVRTRASWRVTRRKMPLRRGARQGDGRGGRGGGRTQLEEQPAVQTANPTTFVTQADFAAMEKRYQDMLRDVLAPFHAAQCQGHNCPWCRRVIV